MKQGQILYRNPETNVLEFKEQNDRLGKIQSFDENRNLVVKEFSDSQLSLLRIADPILTGISQGYKQPGYVGDNLFPSLRMQKETGRFPAWGQDVFIVPGNLKRGIGDEVQHYKPQSGYILASLSEYAEGFGVDNRELNEYAGTPDQYLTHNQNIVNSHILNVRESAQATLATLPGSYASGNSTSGAALDWTNDGKPLVDIDAGKLAIEKKAGVSPNVAWATPTAWKLLRNNNSILQRVTYQGTQAEPAQITPQVFAALIGVDKFVVARAVQVSAEPLSARRGATQGGATTAYMWETVNSGTYAACFGLCYSQVGLDEPSFGLTYDRMNSPIVESWYDNRTKQQMYDTEHFFDAAVTLNSAGYLIYSIA